MRFHLFRPSPKTIERAHRLAEIAHRGWLNIFFFVMCLVESFVMVIPADTLISVTTNIVPDKKRAWFLWSLFGYALGFLIITLLLTTSLKQQALSVFQHVGILGEVQAAKTRLSHYGYFGLGLSILMGMPPLVCMTASVLIGLKPWLVFATTLCVKVVRVGLLIFLVGKLWSAVIQIKKKVEEKG